MFDDFDIQIQSDESEWKFLEWCDTMEDFYYDKENE